MNANNDNSKESTTTRIRFKKFFKSSLFLGIILILLSELLDQLVLSIKMIESTKILNLTIGISISMLKSIGIAFIVGYWVDMVKGSEDYINFINQELRKTVIDKDFIRGLDISEKLDICENLITFDSNALNNHSNIKAYMKSQSNNFLNFFNVNFRSNYTVSVSVYKNDDNKYVAEYDMSYRIYKINHKYQPISIVFEKKSNIKSTVILDENEKILKNLEDTDYKDDITGDSEVKIFEIPEEFYSNEFLTITRKVVEIGHDHWLTLNWSSLTPIDGIHYHVMCKAGIIKEHYIFNEPDVYNKEIKDDKREMTIRSSQWLNSYSGFSIIIADPTGNDN